MNVIRLAVMTIRLVTRMKVALFFTFVFPCIWLFVYAGIFSRGNPSVVSFNFGPVLTLNIMGAGFWGLGLQSVMQRERGSLRRYRLAPISSLTIVASNLLSNYLLQLPVFVLLIGLATFLFHMPFSISFLLPLWFLITVGTFAFAGFGLTLASLANTMQEVQVYNNLLFFALVFLSGVTIPLAVLPHWIQRLATYLPTTYLVSTLQAVMSNSESIWAHMPEMVVLILSGVFGVAIAWKLFRWDKEEKVPTSGKLWALALVVPFVLMGTWMNIYANPTASWTKSYNMMENAASREGAKRNGAEEFHYDFEGPDAAQEISKIWYISSGSAAPASPAGANAELSLISPGANGSQHALQFHGRMDANSQSESTAEVQAELTLPAAIKDFHGIAFSVRSDDARVYQFSVTSAGLGAGSGTEIRLTPSRDWESIHLPAAQLTIAKTSPPQSISFLFKIKTSGPPGDFKVEVDEIQSY